MASVITGCITLAGVLIANGRAQAVMETKVEEQIKVINHRIEDLEGFHKPAGKGGTTLWQENMS